MSILFCLNVSSCWSASEIKLTIDKTLKLSFLFKKLLMCLAVLLVLPVPVVDLIIIELYLLKTSSFI